MKNIIFAAVYLSLVIAFASCEKESGNCALIPAKVIRYDCDRVIFQLLTNENLGDTDWQDTESGSQYHNVISYYNTCAIAELTNGREDTLYVRIKKINENPADSICIQCQAISVNPPQTKVDFIEISQSPCPQSPESLK